MKHTKTLRTLLCLVLVMLLAAAVFTGCNNAKDGGAASGSEPEYEVEEDFGASASDLSTELGVGAKTFCFEVTDKAGNTSSYTIHTDAETVGEALLENKLIDGEESEYGLYVTTVNGETLDWDKDGMYWAFYEGDEYAALGVDATAIVEGASYALVATAG